jgi:hypothetical protein
MTEPTFGQILNREVRLGGEQVDEPAHSFSDKCMKGVAWFFDTAFPWHTGQIVLAMLSPIIFALIGTVIGARVSMWLIDDLINIWKGRGG